MMTPKRRKFVRLIIEGRNPSDAYRRAYNAEGMNERSIANEANRLIRDPDISLMISEGMEAAMEKAIWNRCKAIERMTDVNGRCYAVLMAEDSAVSRDALNGFMGTSKVLNELCNVGAEVREDYAERFQTEEKIMDEARRMQIKADASIYAMFGE